MGDRISVQFRNGNRTSVVFFSHWDGRDLLKAVKAYYKERGMADNKEHMMPLDRKEPNTVMVDFIVWYMAEVGNSRVENNYYLGATSNDGDNSDNGHWVFDLAVGDFE